MPYNTKSILRDASNNPVPQYFNTAIDDYEVTQGESGALFVKLKGHDSHVSVETDATTMETSVSFMVEYIHAISNDGTADIKFNFDADTTQPGTITLKPGEVLEDFPRKCTTLYYKAVSGSQPFRAWGVK